ncbi:hypothetical protein [Patulibacter defluvii]|uniref:hypothetical protein n=1 Tax=Patulibacter defluvii TaxID=3095358 RepID=UPI002A7538AC|nr:hypothetical protein [Patulibacter sp. DM4]
MKRRSPFLVALLATVALVGCGGSDEPKASATDARAAVARAAGVKLADMPVPDDAKDDGVERAYSNQSTAAKDGQIIMLFVLDDAGKADDVAKQVRGSVPGESVQLYTRRNVIVVYGSTGTDRKDAVRTAVERL